jgi:hypothetical protein
VPTSSYLDYAGMDCEWNPNAALRSVQEDFFAKVAKNYEAEEFWKLLSRNLFNGCQVPQHHGAVSAA